VFIELIDLLRCTQPHEDVPLVAAFTAMNGRHVIDGTLACYVCGARYRIGGGIADFGAAATPINGRGVKADGDEWVKLAAYLDLAEEGKLVALGGQWCLHATTLAERTGARVLTINAPPRASDQPESRGAVSDLRCGDVLPLAPGSLHGIALDVLNPTLLTSVARAVRGKGRILIPGSGTLPGIRKLAADEQWIVGEREEGATTSDPVPLRRSKD
jgi:hypothetical protein